MSYSTISGYYPTYMNHCYINLYWLEYKYDSKSHVTPVIIHTFYLQPSSEEYRLGLEWTLAITRKCSRIICVNYVEKIFKDNTNGSVLTNTLVNV